MVHLLSNRDALLMSLGGRQQALVSMTSTQSNGALCEIGDFVGLVCLTVH